MTIKAVSKPMYITTIYTPAFPRAGSPVTIKDTLVRRISAPSGGANTLAVNTKQFTQSQALMPRSANTRLLRLLEAEPIRCAALLFSWRQRRLRPCWNGPSRTKERVTSSLMPGEMLAISTTGTPNGSTFYCTVRWH